MVSRPTSSITRRTFPVCGDVDDQPHTFGARATVVGPEEIEQLVGNRDLHARFAQAAAVGAPRWLGIVPALLSELPAEAAALIAGQLNFAPDALDPGRFPLRPHAHARLVVRGPRSAASGLALRRISASSTPGCRNALWSTAGRTAARRVGLA